MAALPERTGRDPCIITFEEGQLKVTAEIAIYQPAMKTLTLEERDLVEKVVRAQSTLLSLAMFCKGTKSMSNTDWEETLSQILIDARSNIYTIQTEYGVDVAKLLEIDIDLPPSEIPIPS